VEPGREALDCHVTSEGRKPMRNVYRVLAYLLSIEVVIQAMAIGYALAGLGKWIEDDGGVLNKQVLDADDALHFHGVGGFAAHGINGMMIIPILTLALLVVSFFAKVPGGVKRAVILVGLIILQVILGIALHGVPYVAWLHVLNAFAIFVFAFETGRAASVTATTPADPVAV
jgi:heme A synthase